MGADRETGAGRTREQAGHGSGQDTGAGVGAGRTWEQPGPGAGAGAARTWEQPETLTSTDVK